MGILNDILQISHMFPGGAETDDALAHIARLMLLKS